MDVAHTWNYRIFKHPGKDGNADTFAVHECYLEDALVKGFTIKPQSAHYESVEGLIDDLKTMLSDAQNSQESILDYTTLTQALAAVR